MHVLLPIKNLNFAKQRLSSLLNAAERRIFFQAMLNDVLQVLDDHPFIHGITLVSDDPSADALTNKYDLSCITQTSLKTQGLSDTVQAGVLFLGDNGIDDVMVLHGDLPLISEREITDLVHAYATAYKPTVMLTPDRRGTGTNCIVCPAQSNFQFHYGANSFDKHRAQASLCGLKTKVSEQQGISCDIDYPHDLLQFLAQVDSDNAANTQRFLHSNKVFNRLLTQPNDQPLTPHTPRLATVINLAIKQPHKNYAT